MAPLCAHVACTVAFLNVGNNLSIKVLGYWVTFSKYHGLIVRLHKTHVMLRAWAASALTWCYFQSSLVMPTRIFGLLRIKFRAVSATSLPTPSREENKEETSHISGEVVHFSGVRLPGDWSKTQPQNIKLHFLSDWSRLAAAWWLEMNPRRHNPGGNSANLTANNCLVDKNGRKNKEVYSIHLTAWQRSRFA